MRKALLALSVSALALGSFAAIETATAATAKMSAMGCMVGKQRWDASAGKCVDAKPVKKVAKAKAPPKAKVKVKVKPAVKKAM